MRDKVKNEDYFKEFINIHVSSLEKSKAREKEGQIPLNIIPRSRNIRFEYKYKILVAHYSLGSDLETVRCLYAEALALIRDGGWDPNGVKVRLKPGLLADRYMVEPYGYMLRLAAIGFLLKVDESLFKILPELIKRDNVHDKLLWLIVNARLPNALPEPQETYHTEKSVILKTFSPLRAAAEEPDQKAAQKFVKKFLDKGFYHKHCGFYEAHKINKRWNKEMFTYYGYWAFEAAAVSCIRELDDSLYREHQYYPKDLADYYREQAL